MGQKRFLHEKVSHEPIGRYDLKVTFSRKKLFYVIFDAEFEKNTFNSFGEKKMYDSPMDYYISCSIILKKLNVKLISQGNKCRKYIGSRRNLNSNII